jgi:hypothetical protein
MRPLLFKSNRPGTDPEVPAQAQCSGSIPCFGHRQPYGTVRRLTPSRSFQGTCSAAVIKSFGSGHPGQPMLVSAWVRRWVQLDLSAFRGTRAKSTAERQPIVRSTQCNPPTLSCYAHAGPLGGALQLTSHV